MDRCPLPRETALTPVHLVARLHVDLLRLAGALCRR
ncbi:putative leader peptide [Actinomycetospora chibensis]|uniref:Leader peptide n=1 Tax=Actinomycetospora chibensis TaxID=663606 RepID=A0ABV9RGW9_9PSEU